MLLLESDPYHGLSDGEAAQRLERFGPNTLAVVTRASLLARILRQFHHPLIYVLLVAGTITAGLKEFVDAAVIFGVVVINAIVGFIQESKAEAALQGLRSMVNRSWTQARSPPHPRAPAVAAAHLEYRVGLAGVSCLDKATASDIGIRYLPGI